MLCKIRQKKSIGKKEIDEFINYLKTCERRFITRLRNNLHYRDYREFNRDAARKIFDIIVSSINMGKELGLTPRERFIEMFTKIVERPKRKNYNQL